MPATGRFSGTPASISASEVPQTVAIEEEPLDSVISETTRSVYGKAFLGRQQRMDRAPGQLAVADFAAARASPCGPPHRPRTEGSCSAA